MNLIIIILVLYILFPVCIFGKSRVNLKKTKEELISIDDSMYMRGIAAFFVVFAHLLSEVMATEGVRNVFLYPFTWFGGLGVCIFFFLSGYGLWCSYGKKDLNISFLRKRVGRIIPVFVVFRVVIGWIQIESLEIQTLWQYLLYVLGIIKPMWFVVEILLIYLAFFVICKITTQYRLLGMFIFLLIFSVICYVGGLEERWYNSNMLFVLGMLVSHYKSSVKERIHKYPIIYMLIVGFLFCIFSIGFVLTKGMLVSALLKIIAGFCLCMFFVVLNSVIIWSGKIISYAGSNSLEIYLIHQNVWAILLLFELPCDFTFVGAILGSFFVVMFYRYIEKQITTRISKRRT